MTASTPETTRPPSAVKVALLGAGNVGAEVARTLLDHGPEFAARVGAPVELIGIAVRDLAARRTVELPEELLTTDAEALVDAADVVIELTGGIEPARSRILRALHAGKPVISGNKALIARHGRQLQDAADAAGVPLSYEAAVAGAIPIVRPMQDSLAGDRVDRVLGIMNGTTNYILDQMDTTGAQFHDALAEAQELGYAEADPTADVEGHDAAAKAAILASLAFHSTFTIDDVYCRGITGVTAADVAAAREAGYVIKLLAVCERCPGGVNLRVTPTMIPREHPLAGVHGAYNAVFVEAANAGSLMFYGAGAGGAATASAWHPNSVLLAAGSTDGHARVLSSFVKGVDARPEPSAWGERLPFNTVCGEFLNNTAGWVHSVAFSPSGNALAFASHDSTLTVVYPSAPEQPPAAVISISTQVLPFTSLVWTSEDEIIAAGYNCEAYRLQGSEQGWTLAGSLESKGRPGLAEAREESAFNMFRQMDLKGKGSQDDTKLKTVHQNTISTIRSYEESGDKVSKISSSGVDGRVVIWNV